MDAIQDITEITIAQEEAVPIPHIALKPAATNTTAIPMPIAQGVFATPLHHVLLALFLILQIPGIGFGATRISLKN
jgi:hypothetical protein